MPIVESAPADALLGQGDILALPQGGLYLDHKKGTPVSTKPHAGLVISRDCAGDHGKSVLVAEIHPSKLNLPSEDDLEDIVKLLSVLRDGGNNPDTFYLGALPNQTGRFAAKLDSIVTVRLPSPEERAAWLATHRVLRLTEEFRRALPTRLFWALCRQGYDDFAWFSTPDLEYVRHVVDAQKARISAEVHALKADRARAEADANDKAIVAADGKLKTAEDRLKKLNEKATPYLAELAKRGTA